MELATDFEAHDEKAWRALAEKALKGARLESLTTATLDGLALKPLYWADGEAPSAAPYTRGFSALVPDPAWDIRQLHAGPAPACANRAILADLEGGASSITLRLAAPEQAGLAINSADDLAATLDGVYLDFAGVHLEPGIRFKPAAEALMDVWSRAGLDPKSVKGGFGADPLGACARAGGLERSFEDALGDAAALAQITHDTYPGVTALLVDARPYHEGGATEAEELACLAATLTAYLRAMEAAGLSPDQGLGQIGFALSTDADLFLSIAKLRAARALIGRIGDACGAQGALPGLGLSASTSLAMMTKTDPHMNLLRTTAATASAALGGADAITVLPFDAALGEPDGFSQRIARNIQLILQGEAHLGRVRDPAGGSWYAESLSRDLAAKAWELFQGIESQGGMVEALAKGSIQGMLATTAKSRAHGLAVGDKELIGINAFPNLFESISAPETTPAPGPDPLDDPAVTVEPVPLRRPSAPFERLTDAAAAFAKKHGARPQIFLANLGPLAGFTARSNYAQNLFASGGIEPLTNAGFENADAAAAAFKASGAVIACLAGSDEAYAKMGQQVARALVGAGAQHLYLAGRPGDARADLKAAGITTFIHKGADAIAALEEAHAVLGVSPT